MHILVVRVACSAICINHGDVANTSLGQEGGKNARPVPCDRSKFIPFWLSMYLIGHGGRLQPERYARTI